MSGTAAQESYGGGSTKGSDKLLPNSMKKKEKRHTTKQTFKMFVLELFFLVNV